jgi:putative membrane protein
MALGMWFHLKMTAVIILILCHIFLARARKAFERGENKYSENFYRIINEIPTICMIVAVVMVIIKPFE